MEIVFIRHGEPDYAPCWERGFIGHGKDLACLTPEGIKQAEAVSRNSILSGSELIISSPYTRALQTAAIISKNTQLDITVEIDLHEFLPDKTFQFRSKEELDVLFTDFSDCFCSYPTGETRKWETIDMMSERLVKTLQKYLSYDKIIIVTHAMLMHRLIAYGHIPNCHIAEVDFDEDFVSPGWIEFDD